NRLVGAGEGLGQTLHDEAVLDGHRDRSSRSEREGISGIPARLAERTSLGKYLLRGDGHAHGRTGFDRSQRRDFGALNPCEFQLVRLIRLLISLSQALIGRLVPFTGARTLLWEPNKMNKFAVAFAAATLMSLAACGEK